MPLNLDSGEIHEQRTVASSHHNAVILPHKLPRKVDEVGILGRRLPLALVLSNQANTFFALSSKLVRSSADWQ